MSTELLQNNIIVKHSDIQGYGVFAGKDLLPEDIIEECHILLIDDHEDLCNYLFYGDGQHVLPLGYGCIYNHSDDPNAAFYFDPDRHLMIFKAIKPILSGEEIFTSYGQDWFSQRNIEVK